MTFGKVNAKAIVLSLKVVLMEISCPLFQQCKDPLGCFVNLSMIFAKRKFFSKE